MDSYVEYLYNLLDEGISENYMNIKSEDIEQQINQYDVSQDEIEQYLAAPY